MTASRSHFAADLVVTGTVRGTGRLHIDGRVDGDVTVGALAVGERGSLSGTAVADDAAIAGRVHGLVRAATVSVAAAGSLSGVVQYDRLTVAAGGSFEAQCRPSARPAPATAATAARGALDPAGAALRRRPLGQLVAS